MFRMSLDGDDVHVEFDGPFFHEYLATVKSLTFLRFRRKTRTWVFPIYLIDRLLPLLRQLPESPDLSRQLFDRIIINKDAKAKALEARQAKDVDFTPDGFCGNLFAFQRVGVNFLLTARNALLCDDVGLGKTVMACAGFAHLMDAEEITSVLVICPGHLKKQWGKEIERFTYWKPTVVDGTRDRRARQLADANEVVVTNYDLLSRDPEYLERPWGLVILDEAQEIKNYRTVAATLVRKIKTDYKWCMTATAIENILPELYSIFQFLAPGLLGWWEEFDRNYIIRDHFRSIKGYRNIDRLREIIKPHVLRRRVQECLHDFPEKETRIERFDFAPDHRVVYDDVESRVIQMENEERAEAINGSERMSQIGFLRQACDDPRLIAPEYDVSSTKLAWMHGVVEEAKALGERVVIFSEWERMGRLLKDALGGCPFLYGRLSFARRNSILDRWRDAEGPLVTTDCSNVGLNLQQANWLVSYEMHWNPAVMRQRTGRVWRLTQERTVHVRSPILNNSVEERVYETLMGKNELFVNVIDKLATKSKKERLNARKSC